jgi:hypothetical protein
MIGAAEGEQLARSKVKWAGREIGQGEANVTARAGRRMLGKDNYGEDYKLETDLKATKDSLSRRPPR